MYATVKLTSIERECQGMPGRSFGTNIEVLIGRSFVHTQISEGQARIRRLHERVALVD